jgi:hypothetical protein
MKRTDIHRTGAVIPTDYEFVAFGYQQLDCFSMDMPAFLMRQQQILKAHMMKTGGQFSQHEHGGTCHICGANAIYLVKFYHTATNTYVQTGNDCAAKMEMSYGDFNAFQAAVHDAKAAYAGKAKARQILAEKDLNAAWELYSVTVPAMRDAAQKQFDIDGKTTNWLPYEERTIEDMVSKLVRYGSASEKQFGYMRTLLNKIPGRGVQQAQWAKERENAKPAPSGDRVTFTGKIIKLAYHDSKFGRTLKMTVKHADGWAAWGTVPSGLEIEKGDIVTLTANLTPSQDSKTFAFFKRPTQAIKLIDAPC